MGSCISSFISCILDLPAVMKPLLQRALVTVHQSIRPHIRAQYLRQFKLFLAFVLFHQCKVFDSASTVMCFLEFLASNVLSFRLINNYTSAMKHFYEIQLV